MPAKATLQFAPSADEIWGSIIDVIKQNINKRSFSTWFAPIEPVQLVDDVIELKVPNKFFCEWIDNHYSSLLQNAITQVLGDTKKVKYIVDDKKTENVIKKCKKIK